MFKLKVDPKSQRVSFDIKNKTKQLKKQDRKETNRKPSKNTIEQRVRKLENDSNDLWDVINKLEVAMGLKRTIRK